MFPHRIAMLLSPVDVGATGTRVVDLDLSEILSRIWIKFKVINVSDLNIEVPQANITKVEIVDGSDVLWTGTGKAIDAVNFYDCGRPALSSYSYLSGYGAEAMLPINFGRYPFDRLYALDPRKFHNLQLKITFNEALCNAGDHINEMTVWAEAFSKTQPSPVGFFQVKEQYAYSPTVGAYEEIDLPTDMIIRTLYIDALLENGYLGAEIADIRIDEDNLKTIFYDNHYTELMRIYRPYFGKYEHKVLCAVGAAATEINHAPSQELCVQCTDFDAGAGYVSAIRQFGCAGSFIANEATQALLYASGYMPHGIGAIPFGERQTPEDWYDPRGLKRLRLRLQGGGSAAGTYRITTQQIRTY